MLSRKLAFAVIVNLPKAPEQQTVLGIVFLLPYITLVYGHRPYSTPYLNWMDLLGTSFATSLALSGLVMFGGYDTLLTVSEVGRVPGLCGPCSTRARLCAADDTWFHRPQASTIQIVLILLLVAFLGCFVLIDSIPKLKLVLRLSRQKRRLRRLRRQAGAPLVGPPRRALLQPSVAPCVP